MQTVFRGLVVAVCLLAACLAGTAGPASATPPGKFETPKEKIDGIGTYELGDIVELAVVPDGERPKNLASASYIWDVYEIVYDAKTKEYDFKDRKFRQQDDTHIHFGAGIQPRKIRVEVTATYLYIVKDGTNVKEVATKTVRMTGFVVIAGIPPVPGPGPDPVPNPNPPPAPVLPDGKFALSKTMYNLVTTKVAADASRPKAAAALADAYKSMASAIGSGAFTKAEDILAETAKRNKAALATAGVTREAWLPCFQALQDSVFLLYEQKKLNTPDDWKTAWDEISVGLAAVK